MKILSFLALLSVPAVLRVAIVTLTIPKSAVAASPTADWSAPIMSELAGGEVRRVDKDAKKITLRHGDLKGLAMPPMTMVLQVKDPAMLDKVKAGDKVKFRAQNNGGTMAITEIEVSK